MSSHSKIGRLDFFRLTFFEIVVQYAIIFRMLLLLSKFRFIGELHVMNCRGES